jgi:hypothetical protein
MRDFEISIFKIKTGVDLAVGFLYITGIYILINICPVYLILFLSFSNYTPMYFFAG